MAGKSTEKRYEDFADYVRSTRTQRGYSLKQVEERAKERGRDISSGYLSQIENRHVLASSLTLEMIRALSVGLGIPEDEVLDAARGRFSALQGRTELEKQLGHLNWMFTDLPGECRLDVIASVTGIYDRRSTSARIHERHEARAAARAEIEEHASTQQAPPESPALEMLREKQRQSKHGPRMRPLAEYHDSHDTNN